MSRSLEKCLVWFSAMMVVGMLVVGAALSAERAGSASAVKASTDDVKSVADGNNRFALDLYGKLKTGDENLFYSPYSISTALAMTYAGARGQTAEQMAKVLHFDLPPDRLHPACGGLIGSLNEAGEKGGFQLRVANRLWGQKGESFLKSFLNLTERSYGAGLSEVDFVGDTEAARKTINDWVEKQTAEKIKELIKKGLLDRSTALVLTNAIYMKADWLSKFKKHETRDEPFFAAGGKELKVPTMHQTARFGYAEADNLQVLEMAYAGERLSMVVLLPREKDGLGGLEQGLKLESLVNWLAQLKPHKVQVLLPKFKSTREFSLNDVLRSLGMAKAFTPGEADFSGMNGKRNLYISAVVHKAFVAVDEEGTEAAAATGVAMALTAAPMPEQIIEFRADHPFVFLIRDLQTGAILFMGRVTDPSGS
jgi:serpin B